MDIAIFSHLLKDLVLSNDRITVEGIGEFIADTAPAFFSDEGSVLNPPYRRLMFSASCSQKSDIVEDYYASISNLDITSARKELHDMIRFIQETLESEKKVQLPDFGTLHRSGEGSLYFLPDGNAAESFRVYGMEPVQLNTPFPEKEEEELIPAASETVKSGYFDSLQEKKLEVEDIPVEDTKSESEPEPEPELEPDEMPRSKKKSAAGVVILTIVILLLTAALAVLFLHRAGIIDVSTLLYSKEDLQIMSEFGEY